MSPICFPEMISMLRFVVGCDGRLTDGEINVFDNFLTGTLRLSSDERSEASRLFREAPIKGSYEEKARAFFLANQYNTDLLVELLSALTKMALADGELGAEEEILLKETAAIFGVTSRIYENRHVKNSDDAPTEASDRETYYAHILGLRGDYSPTDIREVTRMLMSRYDPQSIEGFGPEVEKTVREQRERIEEAYRFFQARYDF